MAVSVSSLQSVRPDGQPLALAGAWRTWGFLLAAPTAVILVLGLMVPTVLTFLASLRGGFLFGPTPFVGLRNYAAVFARPEFWAALGFTLRIALRRACILSFWPLFAALVLNEFGRGVRYAARSIFLVALAAFSPLVTAIAWRKAAIFAFLPIIPADPGNPRSFLLALDGMQVGALACTLGLACYLMALRGDAAEHRQAPASLPPVWGLIALTCVASALQTFIVVMDSPLSGVQTLASWQFREAMIFTRLGAGSAAAMLALAVLFILGLAAWLIVYLSNLHFTLVPPGDGATLLSGAGKPRWARVATVALLALVFLGAGWMFIRTILHLVLTLIKPAGFPAGMAGGASLLSIALNTLFPTALSVFCLQLPLAYFGGLGIGGFRPLGGKSELLLLPFSPWLFVTAGPLGIVFFNWIRKIGLLNTPAALFPPLLLSVPMLFAFTLFFKGREPFWREAVANGEQAGVSFLKHLFLPSLPVTAALGGLALLFNLQDAMWPSMTVMDRRLATLANALRGSLAMSDWGGIAAVVGGVFLPLAIFFLVLFGLLMWWADALAVTTRREE